MEDAERNKASKNFAINLSADRQYSADAIRAVLSTILFHRLFGTLVPSTSEAVGVTYPVPVHPETESIISQRAKELAHRFRDSAIKTQAVQLRFFSRRVKKSAWFAKTHNFCWESWNVAVAVSPNSKDRPGLLNTGQENQSSSRSASSRELQKALFETIQALDDYKDHIPPITTTDVSPFPYEITIE